MASAFQSAPMTITALSRWSVKSKQLPPVDKIKAIHVYDFDNTLFNTPLPNPKVWNGHTLGLLQSDNVFATGGWWHDNRILAAAGDGIEKEEAKAWKGWWNEEVVKLVELSMQQSDTLTILLTGRKDDRYHDIINRMLESKKLDFDMVVLKPVPGPNNERFPNTMHFKQAYLTSVMETYKGAGEIRVYEDRVKHVKQFRDFFTEYNRRQNGLGGSPTRNPIIAEVVQVADGATLMDPVAEAAVVLQIVNDHNLAVKERRHKGKILEVKKTVFYTGYLINSTDTQKLLTLPNIPTNLPDVELKFHANNILITPRPAPASILEKVGGLGTKLIFEVTGTGAFEHKIWAASVRPVPSSARIYTENPSPLVVLALRRGVRPIDAGRIQNWQPVPAEKQFRFETTVGEKMLLRIEEEDLKQDEYESLFPNRGKRKHEDEDLNVDSGQMNGNGSYDSYHPGQSRGSYQQQHGARSNENRNPRGWGNGPRGNGNNGSGRGRGGGGRGGNGGNGKRGRGGGYNYRSLDDMGGNGGAGGQGYGDRAQVGYGDYSPRGQYAGANQQQGQQNCGGGSQQQNGYNNGNYQQYGGPSNAGQSGGLNQYY